LAIYKTLTQEEKKRSEDLTRLLHEERAKVNSLGIGLEEESKRSLAMEEELERSMHQVSWRARDQSYYSENIFAQKFVQNTANFCKIVSILTSYVCGQIVQKMCIDKK
jgi:hypothetical protein